MADEELEALRAEKLAQLQNQQKVKNKLKKFLKKSKIMKLQSGGENEAEERRNAAEQMKNQILAQILDQQARARRNITINIEINILK